MIAQTINKNLTKKNTVQGSPHGLIFDIQGHSVHDGPGTRTTVFMNQCPLKCVWCSNPESWFSHPVMRYSETRCVCCGDCIKACPENAISVSPKTNELIHNRTKCDQCTTFECVEACKHEGAFLTGEYYTVDELMEILKRNRQFWSSDGGVTFSGGEPLFQKQFISEVLRRCQESYMNVCIETTAHLQTEYFLNIIEYVDWAFIDLKHMDPMVHKKLTGVENTLILKNVRMLAEKDWNGFIVARIPIIPHVNDDEKNIRATARFIKEIGLEVINILPFHRLGESKYKQLGQNYDFANQEAPTQEYMEKIKKIIIQEGIICFVGHDTPF